MVEVEDWYFHEDLVALRRIWVAAEAEAEAVRVAPRPIDPDGGGPSYTRGQLAKIGAAISAGDAYRKRMDELRP